MEKFKSPKPTSHFTTKIKNIKIKAKDNETFHFSKSPNADKKPTNKNFIPIKSNKKNMTKKSIMNPSYSLSDLKSKINDKQTIPLTKKKNENIIKETKIFNIQNKAKGRSLEKVPSQNIQRNKNKTINNLHWRESRPANASWQDERQGRFHRPKRCGPGQQFLRCGLHAGR